MKLNNSLFWIDAFAVLLIVATCAGVGWYTLIRENKTARAVTAAGTDLVTLRRDLAMLTSTIEEQQRSAKALDQDLARQGALPHVTSVERDLQVLVQLAKERDITVLFVQPLPSIEYPGLVEMRFSIEAIGRTGDIVGFMQAIQNVAVWADISYLSITQAAAHNPFGSEGRSAVLTLSLFSSPEAVPQPARPGAPASAGRG